MQELPEALAALGAYRQFVTYKIAPSTTRPGKIDKFPTDYRTGKVVSAHDPQYWTDFATASATGQPVGFVFTSSDPFWFLDIDGCAVGGEWSTTAQQLCTLLAGAAIEISQSGTGLHVFGVGTPPRHGCVNIAAGLEFYHTLRFAALTGNGCVGNCATDLSAVLPILVETYFPVGAESVGGDEGWTDGPCEGWNGPSDDAEIIRRAMMSKSAASAFGTTASFADLWVANESVLSVAYPDLNGRAYNASSADAALAAHLAFWTGRDCERIDRIMRQSSLLRDKWDRKSDPYLERTILAAVGRQVDVLTDKALELPAVSGGSTDGLIRPTPVTGETIASAESQTNLFAGSIYVQELHKAFVPGGKLLKPDQFRVQFGGYQFQMDPMNERVSRDPWEAWTQNRNFRCPKVDGTCFRPDAAAGSIVIRDGQEFVNTYIPINIRRVKGDPKPFLDHLAKVLPDRRDREILLSYMAACVQHKGVKFQWAPLLQGVEGNGKTLFTRCVAEAVGRRYSHLPPANEISEKFNSWLFDSIFIGVEDIYVPNQKQEVFEILKPMITSDFLAKRAMQTDQVMREVVCNFIFNSNHKDGLKKTRNDRRICILFCAQQEFGDLDRDGMSGDYFPKLYTWLKADGYAIVNELLYTYPLSAKFVEELQFRAPLTTTTEEAIRAGAGGVEQEIQEAIEQGYPGFSGGWISTIWLERLLDRLGLSRRITHHKRKEMLEQMGYRYHPALKDGRVNNQVTPDGGKPRLFVAEGSLHMQIADAAAVAKAYESANSNRPMMHQSHAAKVFG
jgi:hypothetical protein